MVIGRTDVQHGLRTVLQHFQEPLLNKQVDDFLFCHQTIFIHFDSVILHDSR